MLNDVPGIEADVTSLLIVTHFVQRVDICVCVLYFVLPWFTFIRDSFDFFQDWMMRNNESKYESKCLNS